MISPPHPSNPPYSLHPSNPLLHPSLGLPFIVENCSLLNVCVCSMVHINGGDEITMDEVDPLYSLTVGSPPLYSTQNSTHQVSPGVTTSIQQPYRSEQLYTAVGGGDGGGGEITADQQGGSPDVSGDPGYSSDTERTLDKAVEVKEQKLYPDNCLRFDLLSCYKSRGVKLNSCYGEFYGGQVTAITGPAGSGRSTLLKILAGIKLVPHLPICSCICVLSVS
eukprot:sb/3469792/